MPAWIKRLDPGHSNKLSLHPMISSSHGGKSCPHLLDEETEAQRGTGMCQRTHSMSVGDPGTGSRSAGTLKRERLLPSSELTAWLSPGHR